MFFRVIVAVYVMLFVSVATVQARTAEPVIFYTAKDTIEVEQGVNRPAPGNECQSYVLTDSDKICLYSDPGIQIEVPKKAQGKRDDEIISYEHKLENSDDMASLRDSLAYPEHIIPEAVEPHDVLLNDKPVLGNQ